jgi:hypothetical protein
MYGVFDFEVRYRFHDPLSYICFFPFHWGRVVSLICRATVSTLVHFTFLSLFPCASKGRVWGYAGGAAHHWHYSFLLDLVRCVHSLIGFRFLVLQSIYFVLLSSVIWCKNRLLLMCYSIHHNNWPSTWRHITNALWCIFVSFGVSWITSCIRFTLLCHSYLNWFSVTYFLILSLGL